VGAPASDRTAKAAAGRETAQVRGRPQTLGDQAGGEGDSEGTDDLPGQADALALAALVGGLVNNDNFTLFVCKEQAVILAPSLRKLHEGSSSSCRLYKTKKHTR
jgi:hypothetical protein